MLGQDQACRGGGQDKDQSGHKGQIRGQVQDGRSLEVPTSGQGVLEGGERAVYSYVGRRRRCEMRKVRAGPTYAAAAPSMVKLLERRGQ